MSLEERTSRIAVLLFTDIVDSVNLERRLGTESYSRLLKLHHQLFRQSLELVGAGRIYQDTGDGFLAVRSGEPVRVPQADARVPRWPVDEDLVRLEL